MGAPRIALTGATRLDDSRVSQDVWDGIMSRYPTAHIVAGVKEVSYGLYRGRQLLVLHGPDVGYAVDSGGLAFYLLDTDGDGLSVDGDGLAVALGCHWWAGGRLNQVLYEPLARMPASSGVVEAYDMTRPEAMALALWLLSCAHDAEGALGETD